ncbi:MAG: GDYXXLXY domain-containing protein [Elusimicrobiota bacterium]
MKKNKLFVFIGVIWLIIIVGFIVTKEFTLRTGKQVLLKTVPVDPRDLFRGDYVVLRYEISSLDLNKISADNSSFQNGDKIYLALKEENGYGVPLKIYKNIRDDGKLYLKGTVKNVYHVYHGYQNLIVDYGIENYFVPEGKGKEIERYRGKRLEVKIAIDQFGNAAIKSLLMDGIALKN